MATIATRAILNNRNLTGAEINVRESVASFCPSYTEPFTSESVKNIADRIGMDNGQCSTVLSSLEKKGEIRREGKTIYLLRLDDDQLDKIAARKYPLLIKLAEVGCVEAELLKLILTDLETARENLPTLERLKKLECRQAIEILENISTFVENNSTSDAFLLHFFLFSKLNHSHLKLNLTQPNIESYSTLNENDSTSLKEDNVLNVLRNVSNDFLEEVGQSPVQISSSEFGTTDTSIEDSDESSADRPNGKNRKTEAPQSGEGTNGTPKTEEPRGGEGKPKRSKRSKSPKETEEKMLTREDIPDDADWLPWLKNLPRYQGISVLGKYKEMIKWSREKHKTPSRVRLIKWLEKEIQDLPMAIIELPETNVSSLPKPKIDRDKPYSLDSKGNPSPLTELQFEREVLGILSGLEEGFALDESAKFYTPEDWERLKKRIEIETEAVAG